MRRPSDAAVRMTYTAVLGAAAADACPRGVHSGTGDWPGRRRNSRRVDAQSIAAASGDGDHGPRWTWVARLEGIVVDQRISVAAR